MNRRTLFKGFALGAANLLVPEPIRAYSFVGGWAGKAIEADWRDHQHWIVGAEDWGRISAVAEPPRLVYRFTFRMTEC